MQIVLPWLCVCNLQLYCIRVAGAVLSHAVQLWVHVYIWSGNVRQSVYDSVY